MLKYLIMGCVWCFIAEAQAFQCFVTISKDNCWTNYTLKVDVSNAANKKIITSITVPQGSSWTRKKFECQAHDAILFTASFSPVFWEADIAKTYLAKKHWILPASVSHGDVAWHLNLCYPAQFAEVPLPPDANGTCACNTDKIPPIPPQ